MSALAVPAAERLIAPTDRKVILQAFGPAATEKNWFLYGITDRGPDQKPGKYPAAAGQPWRPAATEKSASLTLGEAMKRRDTYNANPNKIARHNQEAKEWAWRNKKKPGPPIMRYEVGYYPREGSKLVLRDLDDCRDKTTGEITRPEFVDVLESYDGYIEPSVSGTGFRLVMPREEGDEKFSAAGEANGVGIVASATGKGMALTLRPDRLRLSRGSFTFDALVALRGDLSKAKKEPAENADAALEFAHVSLEDLRDMLAHIINDERSAGSGSGS